MTPRTRLRLVEDNKVEIGVDRRRASSGLGVCRLGLLQRLVLGATWTDPRNRSKWARGLPGASEAPNRPILKRKSTRIWTPARTPVFDPLGRASPDRPLRAILSYLCSPMFHELDIQKNINISPSTTRFSADEDAATSDATGGVSARSEQPWSSDRSSQPSYVSRGRRVRSREKAKKRISGESLLYGWVNEGEGEIYFKSSTIKEISVAATCEARLLE